MDKALKPCYEAAHVNNLCLNAVRKQLIVRTGTGNFTEEADLTQCGIKREV